MRAANIYANFGSALAVLVLCILGAAPAACASVLAAALEIDRNGPESSMDLHLEPGRTWQPLTPLALIDPGSETPPATTAPETQGADRESGGAVKQAQQVAEKVGRSFRESLTGQSVILGVSHALVDLQIQDSSGFTIEDYRSSGDPTPTISYYGAPKEFAAFRPGSKFSGAWVFDVAGAVGGFSGHQTDQMNPNGTTANGKLSGDYAYLVVGTSMWFIWDDATLPLAARITGDVGLGTVTYRGDLNYTSSGQPYSAKIQNDGTNVQLVNYVGVELRAAKVSLSVLAFQFFDNGKSELISQQGQPLASYKHLFRMDIYTLGYVVNF